MSDNLNFTRPNLPWRVEENYQTHRTLHYFYSKQEANDFIDTKFPKLLSQLTQDLNRPKADFRIEASAGYAIVTDPKKTSKIYLSLKAGTTY